MFIPQLAEHFQSQNITALLYDPRHLGESGGSPRNEIDPAKQVSDYSDALTFLLTQPNVDPERIAFWGMSFSATIALCATALDRRAKACIAACPYIDLKPPPEMIRLVLANVMRDRESRLVGNPPTYLPMLTSSGRNPAGLHLYPTDEELEMVMTAQERGAERFENRCTLETYYHFCTWNPEAVIAMMPETSQALVIIPEDDTWSVPDKQRALYDSLKCEIKQKMAVRRKGHLTLFNGEDFEHLMAMQMNFLKWAFRERRI